MNQKDPILRAFLGLLAALIVMLVVVQWQRPIEPATPIVPTEPTEPAKQPTDPVVDETAEWRAEMKAKLPELILARQQEIADADGEPSWRVRHVPEGVIVPLTERGGTPDKDMVIWERFLDLDSDGVDERISMRQEEKPEGDDYSSTNLWINLEKKTDGVWNPIMEEHLLVNRPYFSYWIGQLIIIVDDITGDGRPNVLISNEYSREASKDYTYALLGITDEKQGVLFNSIHVVLREFNN